MKINTCLMKYYFFQMKAVHYLGCAMVCTSYLQYILVLIYKIKKKTLAGGIF